ncbi:MAG: hypothetical protein ACLQJ0_21600 [Steroidobacteraceae bacterium]
MAQLAVRLASRDLGTMAAFAPLKHSCCHGIIGVFGCKFESLVETQTIDGAQNQCGRKGDHDSAIAEQNQLAARQILGQNSGDHDQKNRPEDC